MKVGATPEIGIVLRVLLAMGFRFQAVAFCVGACTHTRARAVSGPRSKHDPLIPPLEGT